MAGFTAAVVDGWLNASFSSTYVALHTADPGSAGATAASAGDATRKSATMSSSASGVKASSGTVGPWTNGGSTETISHLSLWTAVSAGSFQASAALASPVSWSSGHRISLSALSVNVDVLSDGNVTSTGTLGATGAVSAAGVTGKLTGVSRTGTGTITAGGSASGGGSYNNPVTHGDQLTVNDVGPWALQQVPRGSESLTTASAPSGGYYRFDDPDVFSSTSAWPSNANDSNPGVLNAPTLHGGVVTGSPVTIDGYSIPVGVRIVQFQDFSPHEADFYARTSTFKVLFRGCRFRYPGGVSGPGLFNDSTAGSGQQVMMHYCDIGLTGKDVAATSSGILHIKFLGGSNHRMLRNYHTLTSTFHQPNVVGCSYIENWIDEFIFYYGESGPEGDFGSGVWHMNGISSEGGQSVLTIKRNHILAPSPDGATGANGFTAAGQTGYGTQSGQTGYGSGTNPGRLVPQTDCIAIFAATGSNIGASPGSIIVENNLLGGAGVSLYAGNANGGAQNIHVIGNKITTKWWTNGGNYGAITDVPTWGSNGNYQANNTWADDYGTGGNGCTALANRQYPAGNGPRAGSSFIA